MSSSSTPWVMALLGSGTTTHDNEASLWNLDTGKCEHVFRVVPAVASDRAALHIPTLESIPLSIDPSWCPGVRIQGSSTSAARDFDPTKNEWIASVINCNTAFHIQRCARFSLFSLLYI